MNEMTVSDGGKMAVAPGMGSPLGLQAKNSAELTQASREVAEAMIMSQRAMATPRDEVACIDKMHNACMRPSMAKSAIYSYPKGGTSVEGPSIRLLEMCATYWGHIKHGYRIVERGVDYTKIEAYCYDAQTNTLVPREEVVRHYRKAHGVEKFIDDVREVRELVANFASRAERACMEKVIPRDIVDECVEICNQTLQNDNNNSNPEKIKALIAAFGELGVTVAMIEAKIGRHIDGIQPMQVVQMRKIYTSLKDGMSTVDQWFTVAPAQNGGEGGEGGGEKPASEKKPSSSSAEDIRKAFNMKKGSDIKPPAKKKTPPKGGDTEAVDAEVVDSGESAGESSGEGETVPDEMA